MMALQQLFLHRKLVLNKIAL